MKIIKARDYGRMSGYGAEIITELLKNKPCATLGLATGTTPVGLYKELVRAYKRGEISFKDVRTVNLDEYVGLGVESGQSYKSFMREQLFYHVDIDLKNTHIPDGLATDLAEECARYTELLENKPRDIQLLGLGSNGHIGFNEPGSPFDGHTRIVELAATTVADNARLFKNSADVPKRAITMGIADIMQAEKILMLVSGKNKAEAVRGMVKGEISESCPASVLQRHKNVVLVLDDAAASLL